jgi:hypothetical protein
VCHKLILDSNNQMRERGGDFHRSIVILLIFNEKTSFYISSVLLYSPFNFVVDLVSCSFCGGFSSEIFVLGSCSSSARPRFLFPAFSHQSAPHFAAQEVNFPFVLVVVASALFFWLSPLRRFSFSCAGFCHSSSGFSHRSVLLISHQGSRPG